MKYYLLIFLLFMSNVSNADSSNNKFFPYAIYYSDEAKVKDLFHYKLLVLDSDYHPPIQPLIDRGVKVLGYISLGEVEKERAFFSDVQKDNIIIKENINWPGSYYVDVRNNKWPQRVINEIIPSILKQGFDGLFFDTLDNPAELERQDPEEYKDMLQAAVNLVKAIRLHYPDIKIMMNRAYELLPYVAKDIDMVLGESVFADYNFETKENNFVEEELYKEQVKILQDAQNLNSDLVVYTLDYWEPKDSIVVKQIYDEQRKNGFIPYVSKVELDQLFIEPR